MRGRPVGNRVAGPMSPPVVSDRKVLGQDSEGKLELGLALPVVPNAGASRWSRIRALPVVPHPAAAGRPEYGRCRSSRMRAAAVRHGIRRAAGRHGYGALTESSANPWRCTVVANPGTAGCPTASDDTDFASWRLDRSDRPRDSDKWGTAWLGNRVAVGPNTGGAGRPQYGRCRSSGIRAVPIVAKLGRCRSSDCQRPHGTRVRTWTGAFRPR